ncbi:MAG: ABC transporter substrate-binding protein, partial [Myxococcota bacterium]
MWLPWWLACSRDPEPAPSSARPDDGDTLVVGFAFDPGSANPLVLPYTVSHMVADLVEPGLVRRLDEPEGIVFEPVVARAAAWSDDRRTLTYTLRDDVRWGDGTPLTSADVAFTWSLIADPAVASNWHGDAAFVDGVDAPDPTTVVFRFREARNPVLQQIVTARGILPAHRLRTVDRATLRGHESVRDPLASGPWRIASWAPDDRIVLEPNPAAPADWHPHLDRIVIRILPEYTTRLIELERGAIDLLGEVEVPDAARLAADPKIRLVRTEAQQVHYVGWNLADPRFAAVEVREALAMAIDRDALVRELYTSGDARYARPAVGTISPRYASYVAPITPLPYDPAAARARIPPGTRFSLMVATGTPEILRLATVLQAAWKAVGVTVDLELVEPTRFSQRARTKEYEAILWSFGA